MESVGGNYGETLEGVGEEDDTKSSCASQVRGVDSLERGELDGVFELTPSHGSISHPTRRRSMHQSLDIQAMEVETGDIGR